MNIVLAGTFLEILKAGNLNRAAERLHVSQSTVTTRLNTLEEALGQRLFVRNKSGVRLTNAGFKFKRYAETLVHIWNQAQHSLALPEDCTATLVIGFEYDLWDGAVDQWLAWFRSHRRDVALEAWASHPDILESWLASGMVDVAITFRADLKGIQQSEMLFQDRLILVSEQPKAYRPGDRTYVFVDWGEEFRRDHALIYPVNKATNLIFGEGSLALRHLLARGGCAYFPLRAVLRYLHDGHLHLVPRAPEFALPVYLARSPMMHREAWYEEATRVLKDLGAAHAGIPLDTVPFDEYVKSGTVR